MVARAYQIPRSRLLGRQPRSVTTYEYDGDRLVRAITVSESEWTAEDRDSALAHLLEEANRCPGLCRLPMDTTIGQANEGKFESPPPYHCHACEAILARRREWDQPDLDVRDKIFIARRRE